MSCPLYLLIFSRALSHHPSPLQTHTPLHTASHSHASEKSDHLGQHPRALICCIRAAIGIGSEATRGRGRREGASKRERGERGRGRKRWKRVVAAAQCSTQCSAVSRGKPQKCGRLSGRTATTATERTIVIGPWGARGSRRGKGATNHSHTVEG